MAADDPLPPLFEEFPAIPTREWEEKIREDLEVENLTDALQWSSIEGVSLDAFYRRDDLDTISHVSSTSSPPPLATAEHTPANGWRLRQNIWHSDLETVGQLAESAVRGGVSDVGLVASPTSDRDEHTVCTPQELASLLQKEIWTDVDLHLDGGTGAIALFAALTGVAKNGVHIDDRLASVEYDPVGALATGRVSDPAGAFDLVADLFHHPSTDSARVVTADGRPYHNAGASAVQELACTLGALTENITRLLDNGIPLSDILARLQVTTAVSTSYFVEIAKLRALRLLVPQIVDAFAAENDVTVEFEPHDLVVQTHTSRRAETCYDPHVNMLRATTEAMAAVLGGCDVLSVRPYDAQLRPPDRFGTRIARNVQLILKHEAHLDMVADPAAGSYYIEAATDQLARRAWDQFQTLESSGGLLNGLRDGTVQARIEDVRERRRAAVDNRERVLTGTNHYPNLDECRLNDFQALSSCNNGSDNSLPLNTLSLDTLQAALEENTSIRAAIDTLDRGSSPLEPLPSIRLADRFEEMRLRTERYAQEHGGPPLVFLAPLGPAGPRSARSTFARNVFGVAGFEIEDHLKFDSIDEAIDAASDASPDLVVLCSSNAEYSRLAPAFNAARENGEPPPLLVVAGHPDDVDGPLPIEEYIYQDMPFRQKLERIQRRLGILT